MLQNSRWKVWFFTTLSSHPFFFGVKQTNKKQQQKKKHKLHTHTKAGQYYYSLFQALQINIFCQVTETKKGAVNYSDIQITSGLIDPLRM